jgi:putative addiction module killer protein
MRIELTRPSKEWLAELRDPEAQRPIAVRLLRAEAGNLGDWKMLKDAAGLNELRIDYGPEHRVYFARRGQSIILILGGSMKQDQRAAIAAAVRLCDAHR